jgi:hypothetical protein
MGIMCNFEVLEGNWDFEFNSDTANNVPVSFFNWSGTDIPQKIFDLISYESFIDYIRPEPRPSPKTGWSKIHEKVKRENVKDRLKPVKNIHHRRQTPLDRWWWRER